MKHKLDQETHMKIIEKLQGSLLQAHNSDEALVWASTLQRYVDAVSLMEDKEDG